ncbi:MAG: hypothetical protein AAFP04_07220 [Myxococcota bacterium]
MLRTLTTATVLIAMCPGLAHAKQGWGEFADYDNVYHSDRDVNEYVVFAQSTWPMLWYWEGEELYDTIQGSQGEYTTVGKFFQSSSSEHPAPTARLWKGPGNRCVISFRSTIGNTELFEEAWGTLASDANYPIEGVITNAWHHQYQPDGSRIDSYYYRVLQEIGGQIDTAVRSASCAELVATGWSMGAALAQLYAYRSWVEANSPQVGEVYAFNPGPAGNGKFRQDYNNMAKAIGIKSEVFCRIHDPIKNAARLAYFDPSQVNWELGCGDQLGAQINQIYNGEDGVPASHDLRAWRTCGDHIDRDKQCPNGESAAVPWTDTNPVRGTEGAYLNNFVYTTQGSQPDGYECVQVHAWSGSKHSGDYTDNYFCSWQEIGMEWSTTGEIAGKVCTHITEAADNNDDGTSSWGENNYLCIQADSSYLLTWTSNQSIADGAHCVQWYESKRPSWTDNYLCWTTDNDSLLTGSDK